MKFRLQFSVAAAFTVLTMVVLGVAVGLFYLSNRTLAIETAKSAMADARARTDAALVGFVAPVGRTVEAVAALFAAFPHEAGERNGLDVVDAQIGDIDQIYSAFFGGARDGAFRQVVRLPDSVTTFGPAEEPVPEGASRVYRSIDQAVGARLERYLYLDEGGEIVAAQSDTGTFDPRGRPWYAGAIEAEDIVVSPVYVFASTGRPGVTFSRRVTGPGGRLLGVVGVDLSLDAISGILGRIRIGEAGEVFLLSRDGDLISQSGYAGGDAAAEENPVVAAALAEWRGSGRDFFRIEVPGARGAYLVSVQPMSEIFGMQPLVGVVVPERQFVGAIDEATWRALQYAGLILVIAVLATMLLARLLSRHLREVADEARRISDFDLSGDFELRSRVTEVSDLGAAVANMKNSLRSFGAYVPRDLVRSIVSSGQSVTVGGAARELSILFSDIEGFSRKTESMAPEQLMSDLSRYFGEMEAAVSSNGGTIDKYIGDAVMAIWNAPAEDPDHALNACRAALACRAAEKALNRGVDDSSLFPVRTRFGLHCDRVVVGNVGSAGRLQYTALGGAVNLASRIEGLNKVYGTDILVTRNVVDRTHGRFVLRSVDRVSPAGITQPIDIFELVAEKDAAHPVDSATMRELGDWEVCYRLYRSRDWAGALEAFEAHRAMSSRDRLVSIYVERCAGFLAGPPPADWDGVHAFEEK